jgi:hypothetical protein
LLHTDHQAFIRLRDETGDSVVTSLIHPHLNSLLEGVTLPELADDPADCGWDLEVDPGIRAHEIEYCVETLCTSATIPGNLRVPRGSECNDLWLEADGFVDISED